MTIKARCPDCGEVELAPEAFDLQWCTYAPASFYRFTCPSCGAVVCKAADYQTAQLLTSGGVSPVLWHLPEEVLEEHEGPPLTMDDVLDFHSILERDDWFEEHEGPPLTMDDLLDFHSVLEREDWFEELRALVDG